MKNIIAKTYVKNILMFVIGIILFRYAVKVEGTKGCEDA